MRRCRWFHHRTPDLCRFVKYDDRMPPRVPSVPKVPKAPKVPRIPRSHHYHVYVVELDDQVWNSTRFRKANSGWTLGKPFVYVGMTGLDPDVRFDKHKAGIQANVFVRDFGVRLLPKLYDRYNPMPYDAARDMEVELGISLRRLGFGVWQA